ncbi:MAG: alpha/beta hydrolase [Bacteroidota bacterium]
MKKNILRAIKYLLALLVILFLIYVFLPRSYDVPLMAKRETTRYWSLATGSRIGYTLIPAKGERKPFPVIFLQGGPGGAVYDRNIRILAPLSESGFDIYLYDQVGCGFSGRLQSIRDYTVSRHRQDLEEIVKIIGAGKVILIGQSWGAMLATVFMASNPGKVEKLIFTSPGPVLPVNPELNRVRPPDSIYLKVQLFSNRDANERTASLRIRLISYCAATFGIKLASDREADDFLTYRTNETNKSTVCDTARAPEGEAGGGFYAQLMTVNSFASVNDSRPVLKNSGVPVLIMKGQCDNQPWGITAEYAELFQHHKLVVIPDAGHSISVEQPDLYFTTIRDFLTGN